MTKDNTKTYYQRIWFFSIFARLSHWVRVIAMTGLIATGFYIAYPFLASPGSSNILVMGWIRSVHVILGFIFIAIVTARIYLFFFSRKKKELQAVKKMFHMSGYVNNLKSYFLLQKPSYHTGYEPFQFLIYATMYTAMVLTCVTGLTLFAADYHQGLMHYIEPVTNYISYLFGGLAQVRLWHHYATWFFIITVPAHVYMVVWEGIQVRDGSMDSMVSGYRFKQVDIKDTDINQP